MTVLLIHGVPETPAVWDPLRAELGRDDVVALHLPGFGSSSPSGRGATKEEFVEWLIDEVERLDAPVDAVGHDWGGGFLARLVSVRPDLVRSWVLDVGGLAHESFEWHAFAKIWQTPGDGEAFFEQQLATSVEERAERFIGFGIPKESALALAAGLDETMASTILTLYRSAVDVGREWGPGFHNVPTPGLVLIPSDDVFLPAEGAKAGAARAGAPSLVLEGLGHWWMLQDPARGAKVLSDFWAAL